MYLSAETFILYSPVFCTLKQWKGQSSCLTGWHWKGSDSSMYEWEGWEDFEADKIMSALEKKVQNYYQISIKLLSNWFKTDNSKFFLKQWVGLD